jgi:hypothetical protein
MIPTPHELLTLETLVFFAIGMYTLGLLTGVLLYLVWTNK